MSEVALTHSQAVVHDTIRLPRAACPEEVGVPSSAVRELIESLEEAEYNYHSIMILRGGKVAAECHRFPFAVDSPHVVYSISKSVTSCAVGMAVEEGYLTLDTTIAEVFPEYVPENEKEAEKFSKIRVRNLLTMTSGKMPNYLTDKTKGEWIRQYAECKWYAEPGEQFRYVNENIYMLSAMIRRLTGQTVSEFLTPRLWEPLGIETPYWETDENGTESGGWGLFLTPESFAKFALMLQQGGVWDGKQIVPKMYLEKASLPQVATGEADRTGYGYCFWTMNEYEYLAVGVYGQVAYMRKDMDLCVVALSGITGSNDPLYNGIHALAEKVRNFDDTQPQEDLTDFLRNRPLDVLPQEINRSPLEETIQNKVIRFAKPLAANLIGFPPSVLPLVAVFMTKDRAGNMDRFQFDFHGKYALFQWREGDEVCCVRLGLDGRYRVSKVTLAGTRYTIYGAANWEDENTLHLYIRPVECLCIRHLVLRFNEKKVELTTSTQPSLENIMSDVRFTVDQMFHTRPGREVGGILFDSLCKIAEPTMHGDLLDKAEKAPETQEADEILEPEAAEEIQVVEESE